MSIREPEDDDSMAENNDLELKLALNAKVQQEMRRMCDKAGVSTFTDLIKAALKHYDYYLKSSGEIPDEDRPFAAPPY